MKVFDFDPVELSGLYRQQQWLHIRNGVAFEFLDHARQKVRESGVLDVVDGADSQDGPTQHVFDFPAEMDLRQELVEPIALLWGVDPSALVLSQRHIEAYGPRAEPRPAPHRDRFDAGISVALTLAVEQGSHAVLYPEDDLSTDPLLATADRPQARAPGEQTGDAPVGARELEIHDAPGDVLVFPGARRRHARRNCASTELLLLTFNDFGSDPLAEDPTTRPLRLASLAAAEDDRLLGLTPVLSRGFDSISRETGRGTHREVWRLNVWADGVRRSLAVPPHWAALVEELERSPRVSVAEHKTCGRAGLRGDDVVEAVRALVRRGALDLVRS